MSQKFNPTERCSVTFKSPNGKKKVTLDITLDTATNIVNINADFNPQVEQGSKPELYAALAIHLMQTLGTSVQ